VNQQLGVVPNLFRLVANSPAALEGYLGLSGALSKGTLPAPTRERIAWRWRRSTAATIGLSAHVYLGKNVASSKTRKFWPNRRGGSQDAKADAAVRFAVKVTRERGHIADSDLQAVRQAATMMRRSSKSSSTWR